MAFGEVEAARLTNSGRGKNGQDWLAPSQGAGPMLEPWRRSEREQGISPPP